MSGYVDHAWRHAPKAYGGTDPIAFPAAGGSPSYAYLFVLDPGTCLASSSFTPAWDYFTTNAVDTVFSTGGNLTPNNNTAGDAYLHFHAAGYYLCYGDVNWEDGTYERYFYLSTTLVMFNQLEVPAGAAFDVEPSSANGIQERNAHCLVGQAEIDASALLNMRILAYNEDAVNDRAISSATLSAVYWPMTSDWLGADEIYP